MKTTFITLMLSIYCAYAIGQSDSIVLKKQETKINLIVKNQEHNQKTIENKFSVNQNYFSSIMSISKERSDANKKMKEWYLTTLDSINRGLIVNLTIDDLYKLRDIKKNEIDSIYYRSTEFLYAAKKIEPFRFFPVFNNYMCMLYYNDNTRFNLFQNINLNFANDNGSFESEIVSGYLWIFRASLSSVLSKESVSTISSKQLKGLSDKQVDSLVIRTDSINIATNTITKLISGGGEATFSFKTPILNLWGNNPKSIKIKSDFVAKFCFDLPIVGNTVSNDKINMFNTFGLENKVIIPFLNFDIKKKEGFESFAIWGKFDIKNVGGTNNFYSNIGINKERFWYSEYSMGIMYKNYLIYYANQIFYNDNLSNMNKGRLGVALIKQF